jgi:hypothetical protein
MLICAGHALEVLPFSLDLPRDPLTDLGFG